MERFSSTQKHETVTGYVQENRFSLNTRCGRKGGKNTCIVHNKGAGIYRAKNEHKPRACIFQG